MRNRVGPLILFVLLVACESITSSNNDNSSKQIHEFEVQFSGTIPEQVQNFVEGFSSVSHFTKINEWKVQLAQDSPTHLVFAVNKKNLPLFVSQKDSDLLYRFDHVRTAYSLLTIMTLHFKPKDQSLLTNSFKEHSDFNKLVNRLEYLSEKNRSFIFDKLTLSHINKIAIDITNERSVKSNASDPTFNHTISKSDHVTVTGTSKLPFKLSLRDLVREKKSSKQLYAGLKLDSEKYASYTSNTTFKIKNGAFQLNVVPDEQANKSRVQKVVRDIILKTHSILGLETKNYQLNNFLESYAAQNQLANVADKKTAIAYVNKYLTEHKNRFDDYFFETLNLSVIEKENYNYFINTIRTLVVSQNETSILYNTDTFYDELNNFSSFSESKTICFENSKEVNCKPTVKKISYNISSVGCSENEYKIVFGSGFFAPFGLDKGAKVKVGWEFGPVGKSGFWLIPIKKSKHTVTGSTKTVGCFNFGSANELNLSLNIKDHNGRVSNTSKLKIFKPDHKALYTVSTPSAYLAELN